MSNLKIPRLNLRQDLWHKVLLTVVLATCLSYQGCKPGLFYDQNSFDKTTLIKAEAMRVMGLATGQFSDHKTSVESLKNTVNDQIAYEEGRGEKNKKTVEMWKLLMNPNENLLGGFLKRWESQGNLSAGFVGQAKSLVGDNINKILNLEKGKRTR